MATLEALVAQVQALSGADDLLSLHSVLKGPAQDAVLRQSAAGLLTAVANLDPAVHSLGCLYLLEAKARTTNAQVGDAEFLQAACRFLPACSAEQVRLAPFKFTALCRAVKAHCIVLGCPKQGVLPLRTAVAKLCPTTDLLSPVHADLFQLCLLAKCYSGAGVALDADVYSVDPARTACTATDVLLYCYNGALLEIGRRRHPRALQLLLAALTAPTLLLSAITVACLKKFMLLSLVGSGAVPPLPKHTAALVTRAIKTDCGPYSELARLCGLGKSAAELTAFAQGKQQEFEQDGNWGLVRLAIEGAARRQIQKLTQTYLTLSLPDIAAKAGLAGPAEAELAVLRMIDAGEVSARVSERDGMVRFLEEAESFHTAGMTEALDALIARSVELAGKLQAFDMAVSSDKAYITKTELKSQRSKEGGGGLPPSSAAAAAAEQES